MARYKKQRIELSRESLEAQLNESHRQASELRSKVINMGNKIGSSIRTLLDTDNGVAEQAGSVQILGKMYADLLKSEETALSRKLDIAKITRDVLGKDIKDEEGEEQAGPISDQRQLDLQNMIKQYKEGKVEPN